MYWLKSIIRLSLSSTIRSRLPKSFFSFLTTALVGNSSGFYQKRVGSLRSTPSSTQLRWCSAWSISTPKILFTGTSNQRMCFLMRKATSRLLTSDCLRCLSCKTMLYQYVVPQSTWLQKSFIRKDMVSQ